MTNADPRLCAECGAARELCFCSDMEARHCRACHLMLHGVDTPQRDSEPVTETVADTCRDCDKDVWRYAADGTGFCGEHGKVPAA